MFRARKQLSLRSLFGVITVICLGFGFWTVRLVRNPYLSGGLLLLIVVFLVLLCTEIVTRNLPKRIRETVEGNRQRLDGSTSRHRTRVEQRALRKLRGNVLVAFVVFAAPSALLFHVINTRLVPVSIGLDAVSQFRLSDDQWKQELKDTGVERSFEKWARNNGNISAPDDIKQMLWRNWPMIVFGGAAWCMLGLTVLSSFCISAIRELEEGARSRAQKYLFRDLAAAEYELDQQRNPQELPTAWESGKLRAVHDAH